MTRDSRSGSRPADHDSQAGERRTLPNLRDLVAAIGLLTALPISRPSAGSVAFARATVFFPLVGLGIGAVLASLNWVVGSRLPPWAAAILLVACWEGLSPPVTLQRGGERFGHTRPQWLALALAGGLMGAKVACLAALAGGRAAALLFAPMLGRWCIVVLAIGARDARAPRRKFNSAITFREFALTSIFSCGTVFTVADATGIFIVVCVAAACLAGRLLTHRWADGVTWVVLGASAQGVETLVLFLWTLL